MASYIYPFFFVDQSIYEFVPDLVFLVDTLLLDNTSNATLNKASVRSYLELRTPKFYFSEMVQSRRARI